LFFEKGHGIAFFANSVKHWQCHSATTKRPGNPKLVIKIQVS
jgi:hypothetical protein